MASTSSEQKDLGVVVLIHGIRSFAYWQNDVRSCLEASGFSVELTNYERFDLFRFLAPTAFFRKAIVERVWHQIEQIYQIHKGRRISFIAHSFGTYILETIMRTKFNFKAERVIFCGSVVRFDAELEQVTSRFNPPLLNEVGAGDVWPAVAQSVTIGYGSAGTYGFRRPFVRDRWHATAGHDYFLNASFCKRFWVPFLTNGEIVSGETKPQPQPAWVQFLYFAKLKYLALAVAAGTLYNIPWQRVTTYPVDHWVARAELARAAGTVHPSKPLPNDLVQPRAEFEAWWNNAGLSARRALKEDTAFKALAYNARLYRMYERLDDLKPNALFWSQQCVAYFEHLQNAQKITECLLDLAAVYLDLSQIQHASPSNFRSIAENGDQIMIRASSIASSSQLPEVNRIASRFYYNLARPRDGLLSGPWSNNYLMLALDRAKAAMTAKPNDIRNVTQFSRVVQRTAANPPQDMDPKWTTELQDAQRQMLGRYTFDRDKLRTPESKIPPANILAVMSMDLARRVWLASDKSINASHEALTFLDEKALAVQVEAWSVVRSTEWAKDYTFDLNYDLARMRALKVQILDHIADASADRVFDDALADLRTAAGVAASTQLRAAARSIDADPNFAALSEGRRTRLRAEVQVR